MPGSEYPDEQRVTITAKRGQFIRVRAMTEVNGRLWTRWETINFGADPSQLTERGE